MLVNLLKFIETGNDLKIVVFKYPIFSTWRLRQEDRKFEVSLGYVANKIKRNSILSIQQSFHVGPKPYL
jgi:hypothetical protein